MDGNDTSGDWSPKFIHDVATTDDRLGTHRQLAEAMARVIKTNREVKLIGLLGPWGSGKSTVVKMFCEVLESEEAAKDIVFTYDAWLQQSDPPRRSFLESLLHFLTLKDEALKEKTELKEALKVELNKLNRRIEENTTITVPRLKWPGTLMAISLLVTVFGAKFVSLDWYKAAFASTPPPADSIHLSSWPWIRWYELVVASQAGSPSVPSALWIFLLGVVLCLAPVALGFGFWYSWRPIRKFWRRDFWRWQNLKEHCEEHKNDSILALYMNKESKTDYNRIIRDPEPSAIEFQDTFRGIVEETIKAERRLIIVIDNLDRLPGEEALAMWATIRSLFLGSDVGLNQRRTRYDPIIVLPIAEEALARMYKCDEGDRLARSFMDKTFDLTFRVNRLVLTKWYEYLSAQMSKVFNTEFQHSWAFVTGRLYDRYSTAGDGTTITPRSINTLINSTAALWMLWRGKVKFASVAYYCIWRDAIDANVVQALSTPNATIREHDENWQASVAAIHYGVSPEEASSVLLELPLKRAIAKREYDDFTRMANIAGFGLILHKAVEDGGSSPDSKSLFNTSLLLGRLEAGGGSELHAETWGLLRAQVPSVEGAFDFGMDEAEALGLMYSSCPDNRKAAFLRDCDGLLQRIPPNIVSNAEFQKAFVHFWGNVERDDNVENLLPEVIHVPGDANVLCLTASQFGATSKIFRRLDSRIDNSAMSQYIVSLLQGTTNGEMTELRISTLMALPRKFEWSNAFDQVLGLVRTANVNPEALRAALFVVVSEELKRRKLDDVVALATDGSLGGRLNEAYNAKNDVVMGRILALQLLSAKPISLPNAPEWPQMLADRELFRSELNGTLRKFDASGWNVVTRLVAAQKSTPSIHSLVVLVASEWIEFGFMNRLNVDAAIDDLPSYLGLMKSDELKKKFVMRLVNFKEFWELMQAKKLEGNVSDIFEILLNAPSTSGKAKEELRKHLAEDSAESWAGWLASGGKPLGLALRSKSDQGDGLESTALYDALEKAIPKILASADFGSIERWFAVAGLADDRSLGMLYKRMRDLIAAGTNVPSLFSVIAEGGVQLIERGHFSDRADDMVRYVIVPLLDKKEGLALLVKLKHSFLASVEACEPSTREFVGDRLNQSVSGEDQEIAEGRALLLEAWGLSPSSQVGGAGQPDERPN